jgi:hypothetical protein
VSEDVEATQLMLRTLFDIRAKVTDLHDALIGGDDEEEEEEADS